MKHILALFLVLCCLCTAALVPAAFADGEARVVDLSRESAGMPDLTPGVDLSQSGSLGVDAICEQIRSVEAGTVVELMNPDGSCDLTLEDVKTIHEANPDVLLSYSFSLFGAPVSLLDGTIRYKNASIGDSNISVFYDLLPMMPLCSRVVLDDCGVSNEVMAELREAFPDKEIVWRVHFNNFSILTDAWTIRAVSQVNNYGGVENLKYCNEVRFIDFGHNTDLWDIDFMRYMPHLKILIVVDAPIHNIDALAECKELELLEIVNCNNLETIEPLASCESLRFLNFSSSYGIRDLSPLYGLEHLERLYAARNSIPEEQVSHIQELMPDCWTVFSMPDESRVSYNYSIGWRLDAAPNERAEWYVELREIFGVVQEYYSYNNAGDAPSPELHVFG